MKNTKMLSFFVSFGMNKKTNRKEHKKTTLIDVVCYHTGTNKYYNTCLLLPKEHKKTTLIDVGYIYYNNTCLLLRAYSFYSLLYN